MGRINRVCDNGESSQPKNMGGKKQCSEAPVKTVTLVVGEQSFANEAAMDVDATVKTEIETKKLVPMATITGLELANTEAVKKEGRYETTTTKDAVAGVKYRFDLSMCTYEALLSYKDKVERIYESTNDKEVFADVQADGVVKGRPITSMDIGIRNQATDDDTPYVDVTFTFESPLHDILKPAVDFTKLEGVFDTQISLVGAPTATSIKFKVESDCTGRAVKSWEDGDVVLKDNTGGVHSIDAFVAPDADGVYEITGTGFANDFTLESNGVVAKTEAMYETPEPLTITGIV